MRIAPIAMAAMLFFGTLGPALASGTLRSQESDGTVRTYDNVSIKVVNHTLRITTHDGKGTLVVSQAACSYVGEIKRCYPTKITLEQGGAMKPIDLKNGTIYVNTTDQPQPLQFTSHQLPPGGILFSIKTDIGTYVTVTGKVDSGLTR